MNPLPEAEQPAARRRAAPLSPESRRAAILEAVAPLVRERGVETTTRELAAAAGVAEGTLFRVFADKHSLLVETALTGLIRASDPEVARADLAAIDPAPPLIERVAQIIERGQGRIAEASRWGAVLFQLRPRGRQVHHDERVTELAEQLATQRQAHQQAVADGLRTAFARDLGGLRVPVEVAVAVVESTIAHSLGGPDQDRPALDPQVLADAIVHGLIGTGPPEADHLPETNHLLPSNHQEP